MGCFEAKIAGFSKDYGKIRSLWQLNFIVLFMILLEDSLGENGLSRRARKPVDINKPGMLLHGIENLPPEAALQIVLNEGLKPSNEQQYRSHIYSMSPKKVCLAMVGKGGFKWSTAATFGADVRTSSEHISVVVNPEYVKAHANEFKAVGAFFNSRNPVGQEYRKAIKKLL